MQLMTNSNLSKAIAAESIRSAGRADGAPDQARDAKGQFAAQGGAARASAKEALAHAQTMRSIAEKSGKPEHAEAVKQAERTAKSARASARGAERATSEAEANLHAATAAKHAEKNASLVSQHLPGGSPESKLQEAVKAEKARTPDALTKTTADHAKDAERLWNESGSHASMAKQSAINAEQSRTQEEAHTHAADARKHAENADISAHHAKEAAARAAEAHEAAPNSAFNSGSAAALKDAREHREMAKENARDAKRSADKAERIAKEKPSSWDLPAGFKTQPQDVASRNASNESKLANERNTVTSHENARDAHSNAADIHRELGNDTFADAHRAMASEHAAKAKSLRGEPPPRRELSDHRRASEEADHATRDAQLEASRARREGTPSRLQSAIRANYNAANLHSLAAVKNSHAGNNDRASYHDAKSRMHIKAAQTLEAKRGK